MQRKTLTLVAFATGAALATAPYASADQVALYDFEEFATDSSSWPANNGPYQNSVTSSLGSTSGLVNVGAGALEALNDRATGDAIGSYALLIGPSNLSSGNPTSADDYLGFTFTASTLVEFTSFDFELGISNTSTAELNHEARAQVFYSIDGGDTFTAIGDSQLVEVPLGETGFSGMVGSSIDLTSLASLGVGDTIEFRLGLTNNRGYGSGTGGVYVDNVSLSAVPEPASLALLGLGGLAMLGRRRR